MTEQKLNRIIEAIKNLSVETDVEADDIAEQLVGFCWDEEDGWYIKSVLRSDETDAYGGNTPIVPDKVIKDWKSLGYIS